MIQVIPFRAAQKPDYLPLLARGLTDLSVLRLNSVEITAQINLELEFDSAKLQPSGRSIRLNLKDQELYFSGSLASTATSELTMQLVLYEPKSGQIIRQSSFQGSEQRFLEEWEIHFQELLRYLKRDPRAELNRRMYTRSLEAFLAFRKGLESLAQAQNERDREAGMEELLKSVSYDPAYVEAADILMLFLFQADLSAGYDRSIDVLERLRQIVTYHPRIPLMLAEAYYQAGNNQKAEKLLLELTAAFPEFIEGQVRLALFYHSTARSDQAMQVLLKLRGDHPKDPAVLDLMGAIAANQGEHGRAEQLWLKALKLDPGRVNLFSNLALLAEEQKDPEKAETYYQQALKVNPEWWATSFNYGSFCQRQGRFEEARVWLEQAVKRNSGHFQSWQNLALTQIQLEQYDAAQESLLTLLQLAPDNSTRRQSLQLLDRLDDPEIQIELRIRQLERLWQPGSRGSVGTILIRLLKLLPQARRHWYYWYLWGRWAELIQLSVLARLFWLIGLGYRPGFPLLKRVGLIYWSRQRFAKALPHLRQAFQLYPSDPETAQAYFQTLVNLGEFQELQHNLKRFTRFKPFQASAAQGHGLR